MVQESPAILLNSYSWRNVLVSFIFIIFVENLTGIQNYLKVVNWKVSSVELNSYIS